MDEFVALVVLLPEEGVVVVILSPKISNKLEVEGMVAVAVILLEST